MSDTLMTIIGIFIAVILMFILPFSIMANKNDEIAQTVVQVAVSDFVETVTNQGRITEFDYSKLVQKISATGNAYDIQIEAQIIDDNSRRATSTADSSQTGEYNYYSVYTNAIMDKIEKDGFYELKKDDYVIVNVKNTNTTLGTQFKNMFYKLVGKDTYTIGTSSSGIVVNSDTNIEKVEVITPNKPTTTEKEVIIKAKHKVKEEQVISSDLDVVVILDCEHTTMPWHNDNNTSENFVRNIIQGVGNTGSLSFILTCYPTRVYTDLSNISWIRQADETKNIASNYSQAINTALNTVKDKTGNRCIVFLSYKPGSNNCSLAIQVLKNNTSNFDIFCTTACCGNLNGSKGDIFDYSKWHNAIPRDKSGGHLIGEDIKKKFESLTKKTVLVDKVVDLPEKTITSNGLKIKLDKYDDTYPVNVIVDGASYEVGRTLPSYVLYFDTEMNAYVIDIKLVKEILNITDSLWATTNIQVDYVQTT